VVLRVDVFWSVGTPGGSGVNWTLVDGAVVDVMSDVRDEVDSATEKQTDKSRRSPPAMPRRAPCLPIWFVRFCLFELSDGGVSFLVDWSLDPRSFDGSLGLLMFGALEGVP
jgi:hypothetical protein